MKISHRAFNSGLWDSRFTMRSDLETYIRACREIDNFNVGESGCVVRRRGFKPVSDAFEFSVPQDSVASYRFIKRDESWSLIVVGVNANNVRVRCFDFDSKGNFVKAHAEIIFNLTVISVPRFGLIRFKQIKDEVYVCCGEFEPFKIVWDGTKFSVGKITFHPPPMDVEITAETEQSFVGKTLADKTAGDEADDDGTTFKKTNYCYTDGELSLSQDVLSKLSALDTVLLYGDTVFTYKDDWKYNGGALYVSPAFPAFGKVELKTLGGCKWAGTALVESSINNGKTWSTIGEITAPVNLALYPATTVDVEDFGTLVRVRLKDRQKGTYIQTDSSGNPNGQYPEQDLGFSFQLKITSSSLVYYFSIVRASIIEPKGTVFTKKDGTPIYPTIFVPEAGATPEIYEAINTQAIGGQIYSSVSTSKIATCYFIFNEELKYNLSVSGAFVINGDDGGSTSRTILLKINNAFIYNTKRYNPGIYEFANGAEITPIIPVPGEPVAIEITQYSFAKCQTYPVSNTVSCLTPTITNISSRKYALAAFTKSSGYPQTLECFQSRLWYAGTEHSPTTIWASRTNKFNDFFVSSLANSSLMFTPSSSSYTGIRWMKDFKNCIMIGTRDSEIVVSSGTSNPAITASSINIAIQSSYGSADHDSELSGDSIFYIKNDNKSIMRQQYAYATDAYASVGCCDFIKDFFDSDKIRDFSCYNDYPATVWVSTENSKIYRYVYNDQQQISTWCKYSLPKDIKILNIKSFTKNEKENLVVLAKVENKYQLLVLSDDNYEYDKYFDKSATLTAEQYESTIETMPILYDDQNQYGKKLQIAKIKIYGDGVGDFNIRYNDSDNFQTFYGGFDTNLENIYHSGEIEIPIDSSISNWLNVQFKTKSATPVKIYGYSLALSSTN